jgi:hypothetical protein
MIEPTRTSTRSLRQDEPDRAVAWDRILVWFMRCVAAMWIIKALGSWTTILGVDVFGGPSFEDMPVGIRAMVVAFAVLDPVAAVGLWLTSTWGGVMWLLAVLSHLLIAGVRPQGAFVSPLLAAVEVVLIVLYVVLSWFASREA